MSDSLTAATVRIVGHDGDEIEAYLACPQVENRRGGVVIHHMPGYDPRARTVTVLPDVKENRAGVVCPVPADRRVLRTLALNDVDELRLIHRRHRDDTTAQLNARARPWIWGRPAPPTRKLRRRCVYTL